MKLNKIHFYNLGLIIDMIKEIFPDICQPIDVLNRTVDMFNDHNASLRIKVMCTHGVIETDIGYFGLRNLSTK